MTDHLTYSLLVLGLVMGCTRPQGQARDNNNKQIDFLNLKYN